MLLIRFILQLRSSPPKNIKLSMTSIAIVYIIFANNKEGSIIEGVSWFWMPSPSHTRILLYYSNTTSRNTTRIHSRIQLLENSNTTSPSRTEKHTLTTWCSDFYFFKQLISWEVGAMLSQCFCENSMSCENIAALHQNHLANTKT